MKDNKATFTEFVLVSLMLTLNRCLPLGDEFDKNATIIGVIPISLSFQELKRLLEGTKTFSDQNLE